MSKQKNLELIVNNSNAASSQQPTKQEKNRKVNFHIKFLSGLIGSTLSSFFCSPLDLIKVRLQTGIDNNKIPKYSSFTDAVRTIYKEEGIRGFFKGARIAVVTVPVFYSLYFPIYEHSKHFYSKLIYNQDNYNNSVIYTLSSGSSAILCDLITNPMWVVRIRKQTEFIHSGCKKMDSFNIIKEVIKLYKNEGFWALYRGLVASIFGIPHVIIQFNVYEILKDYYSKKYERDYSELPMHLIFFISIVAKSKNFIYLLLKNSVFASSLTYPHEVIRNNLQNERNYDKKQMNMTKLIKNIYQAQGIRGFYGGFRINLLRILPNNAIMFTSYEKLSYYLENLYEKRKKLDKVL